MARNYKIKYPTQYNYHKFRMFEDEIFESVDMWDDLFEIKYIGYDKRKKIEHWTCTNTEKGYVVHCTSELMAHKICMVAMYKLWWREDKSVKIPMISTTVNHKSDMLIGTLI